jgi:hypothetical protein
MANSGKLIGTTEHVTLYASCRLNRCRYNGVGQSTLSKVAFDTDFCITLVTPNKTKLAKLQ